MNQNDVLICEQAMSLLNVETDPIANAANLASLIYHNVSDVNWAGFYFLRGNELVLGPFCGRVACTRIQVAKGVCGTAIATGETQLVEDVHQFEGHIACDVASESEVVVPFQTSSVSGVLDIDSPNKQRFQLSDKALFERLVDIYVDSLRCS